MTGILLFGFIFKCIDFRIRIDIRSNQTQHQNVNQKVNAKDLITRFDKLTGFYDKMFMEAGSAGVHGGVDGTILPSYLLPLFEIVKKDLEQDGNAESGLPSYCGIDFGSGLSFAMLCYDDHGQFSALKMFVVNDLRAGRSLVHRLWWVCAVHLQDAPKVSSSVSPLGGLNALA